MTSISHTQRYIPHELNTKYYATKLYRSGYPISFVCRRYKISKSSLMRRNRKFNETKESLIDKSHKTQTPRHNRKVERSHRNDQNRFYNYLKFYSYDDLKYQMKNYLNKSNNIPMQVLDWLSPIEKRNKINETKTIVYLHELIFFLFYCLGITSLTTTQNMKNIFQPLVQFS